MGAILQKVKTALRISKNNLDGELTDQIEAAVNDLRLVGVNVGSDAEPLVLAAVKTYVIAHMTDDKTKAELFERRYETQKSCLKLSARYGTYISDNSEGDAEDAE